MPYLRLLLRIWSRSYGALMPGYGQIRKINKDQVWQIEYTLEGSVSAVSKYFFRFFESYKVFNDSLCGYPILVVFRSVCTVFCFKCSILFYFDQVVREKNNCFENSSKISCATSNIFYGKEKTYWIFVFREIAAILMSDAEKSTRNTATLKINIPWCVTQRLHTSSFEWFGFF